MDPTYCTVALGLPCTYKLRYRPAASENLFQNSPTPTPSPRAAMPTSLGGGLNNMLMHLSQLLADNCTLELSQIRLNTGDQFFRRSARRSHPTRTAGQALDRMSAWVRRPTRRGAADARGIRSVRSAPDTPRARPRLARVHARPPRRRRAAVGAASAREHQS